jgi:hypothetical protein
MKQYVDVTGIQAECCTDLGTGSPLEIPGAQDVRASPVQPVEGFVDNQFAEEIALGILLRRARRDLVESSEARLLAQQRQDTESDEGAEVRERGVSGLSARQLCAVLQERILQYIGGGGGMETIP